jgi:mono/diheme cytochrome c family protein
MVQSNIGWRAILLAGILVASAAAQEAVIPSKLYRIIDGKVDVGTYNGYRRYHVVCNHCHGPDGMGSSFGPSLVDHLPDIENFRRVVRDGKSSGAASAELDWQQRAVRREFSGGLEIARVPHQRSPRQNRDLRHFASSPTH